MKRQSPDPEAVVQIGILQSAGPANPKGKGISKNSWVRQEPRDQRREESDACKPDNKQAIGRRDVQIDVKPCEKLRPRCRNAFDEIAPARGIWATLVTYGIVRSDFRRPRLRWQRGLG